MKSAVVNDPRRCSEVPFTGSFVRLESVPASHRASPAKMKGPGAG